MNDSIIRAGAVVDCCILDKLVEVGENVKLGTGKDDTPNQLEPDKIYTGITIVGKRAVIPPETLIGRNCRIDPDTTPEDYKSKKIASGETILRSSE